MKNHPFEYIYSVVIGGKARIYTKEGTARSQITRMVKQTGNRSSTVFLEDCSLWRVGDNGWEILFEATQGTTYEAIPWQNAIEGNARREAVYEAERLRDEEAHARARYEKLKERFEG